MSTSVIIVLWTVGTGLVVAVLTLASVRWESSASKWKERASRMADSVVGWVWLFFVVLVIGLVLHVAGVNVGGSSSSSSTSSPSSADFCSTHDCIPNFDNGNGSAVQCADGEWSQSGGIQGACSGHGGER